jgi:hypothetical protein
MYRIDRGNRLEMLTHSTLLRPRSPVTIFTRTHMLTLQTSETLVPDVGALLSFCPTPFSYPLFFNKSIFENLEEQCHPLFLPSVQSTPRALPTAR